PWPGTYTVFLRGEGRQGFLRVLEAEVVEGAPGDVPGTVISAGEFIEVACGEGALRIRRLQAEGRKAMSAREFLNGQKLSAGAVFG
ncbi:MAG: methionyl-tRNA formyltransferase, partial [Planctomycetes bacterium]|nr:methionyl-tRNA formyltransferase [Planctomycetota bacterium]